MLLVDRREIEFDGGALVYCLSVSPRVADKSIRVEANCVILAFRSQFSQAPAPEIGEGTSRAAVAVKSWKWIEPGRETRR